ncbi:MAG TPA: hypothetical protein VNA44_02535 [Burkholderiaceae bacterium]|nr:hypothetical protein [Burkholderiaceae bacterium]
MGDHLYVVADDEHHLAVFAADDHRLAGTLVRVRRGALPSAKEARKRRKPDFESLVTLRPFGTYPYGALFAIGSGSKPNRRSAVLLALTAHGSAHGAPRTVSLQNWFTRLRREFGEVNLEGAFVQGENLTLLQRGNKGSPRNACVRIALAPLLDAMAKRRSVPSPRLASVADFDLGVFDGTPLCFTDGAALPGGGFVFTAVAEATEDSYADGACVGAAIGIIDADDRLRALWQLVPTLKIEGIEARVTGKGLELTVVTDADRASVAAQLLTVTLR